MLEAATLTVGLAVAWPAERKPVAAVVVAVAVAVAVAAWIGRT